MSDREAYVAWYVTEFGRHPIDYGYESHVTWKAWQAAQAQDQAVNQQLLDHVVNMMIAAQKAIRLERYRDARNYLQAAIAAAQSQAQEVAIAPAQAVPKCDHVMATNTIKWDDRTQKEGPFCIKCGATQSQEPDTKTLITDRSKWRVDDLVQDINGDIFTIDGVKGDKLLIKDAGENLWLTLAAELTWHSRPTENQNSET